MPATVVDASALAAVLFDEPEAPAVVASVSGELVAPALLRFELASVCTTKLIRYPQQARQIAARWALLDSLQIRYAETDWADLPWLVRRWSLSAYDAAYLQLALSLGARLVTLDARLAAAWDDAAAGAAHDP